jgi:hypothetical protein
MFAAGLIDHDHLFFTADGAVIRHLKYVARRWGHSLRRLSDIRYRRPYNARHSSVSWNLMIGKSPLWVSKQHGHGPETMFRAYTAWTEGAPESEIALIKTAMGFRRSVAAHERQRGRFSGCATCHQNRHNGQFASG